MALFWVQNSNVWIHQNLNSPKVQIHRITDWIYRNLSNFSKYWIHWTVEFVEALNFTNSVLIRKVEFIKLLNLSKPGARRSFIFVEPLHLANYQIHRTSEFIEISNSWKPQIYRILDRVSVQSFTFIDSKGHRQADTDSPMWFCGGGTWASKVLLWRAYLWAISFFVW